MYTINTISDLHRLPLPDCSVLGPIHTTTLHPEVQKAIHDQYDVNVTMASIFYRAVINGKTYHSKEYTRTKVRNSYTVSYIDNGIPKYGFIQYFLSLPSFSVAVITPLTPTSHYCYPQQLSILCKCLIPVCTESSVAIACTKSLLNKCVCIDLCTAMFIAKLPNQLYYD